MSPRRRSRTRSPRSAAAWLLALALVVAQALGVVHRIEHAPRGAGAGAAQDGGLGDVRVGRSASAGAMAATEDAVDSSAADATDVPVVASASDGKRDGRGHDCAAFDHASVADAAPVPPAPTVVSEATRHAVTRPAATPPIAAQASGYFARGPPAA